MFSFILSHVCITNENLFDCSHLMFSFLHYCVPFKCRSKKLKRIEVQLRALALLVFQVTKESYRNKSTPCKLQNGPTSYT